MRSGQDLIWSPKLPPAAAKFAIFFVSTAIPYSLNLPLPSKILAGAEGFEPPSSVLETDSLTVELTPLCASGGRLIVIGRPEITRSPDLPIYFTSLCGVCLRQRLQNFLNSSRSVVVFRFLVVE